MPVVEFGFGAVLCAVGTAGIAEGLRRQEFRLLVLSVACVWVGGAMLYLVIHP